MIRIGPIRVHDITFPETLSLVDRWLAEGAAGYLCTPNADHVIKAGRLAPFRDAINGATLRVPDGMWIVYASRIAGRPLRATVTGRLLVQEVSTLAARRGLPIGLFGAGPGVAQEAADRLVAQLAGLRITAAVSPPEDFRVGSGEDDRLTETLLESDPRVVFVALGAPKQELWMQRHAAQFDHSVLIGVGAAFDILAGRFREAPGWMTRWGLEWLFRLVQEPRRLARRYLVDDPWILVWALRARLGFAEGGRPATPPKSRQ